ncbi:MAG TPA: ABC transporter permease DevC [Acetobacteraceae bacterium]|nr:ABC transporter permease DevC [Acetobacteraceae bacterium]
MPRPLLPVRLAWRQLRAEPARLLVAVAGVMFASVLVLMQLGFRAALFDTATALPRAMQGELFLINPLTTALFRAEPIPRVRGYQALAVPDVAQAVPIYLAQEPWRNPETGTHRAIQIIGFDVEAGAIAIPGLAPLAAALTRRDTVAFDSLSRPEFGDIRRLMAEHGSLKAQLGDHAVEVVGTVRLGASFGADGNVVMSASNFRRLVPESRQSDAALIALRLKKGADVRQVRNRLSTLLPPDVRVVTHAGLVQWEKRYWDKTTPIGVIFAFGSVMGLMVGMVIVYQILFTDVCSHLRGYATLKALGFSHRYLQLVVLGEALILACLGFLPGLLLSAGLYRYVGRAAYLPLDLTNDRCIAVFGLILAMCAVAGLLALRKLREADPASVF